MWFYLRSYLLLIPAINCHPPYILNSIVLILLIIERNICIHTKKYKFILRISRFDVHNKDHWNKPKMGKLGKLLKIIS